jgi:hypothetical protein
MKVLCRSICVAVLLLLTSAVVAAERPKREMKNGKPVYDVCLFNLYPGTLSKMYDASDAVVDLRIISSEAKAVAGLPRTYYTATVLRALKSGLTKGQTIVFSHAAGEVELPDKILRANDLHTLSVGERYVVFLRRHEPYGGYILTGEREGAFRVSNGRIDPQGEGSVAADQRNVTERQFDDEIDRVARHAIPKP